MLITLAVAGVGLVKVALQQHNKTMQAIWEALQKRHGQCT